MNDRIKEIITVVLKNQVLCVDTNFKALYNKFIKIEPNSLKYHTLFRRMKKDNYFIFSVDDKEYHIQITPKEKL